MMIRAMIQIAILSRALSVRQYLQLKEFPQCYSILCSIYFYQATPWKLEFVARLSAHFMTDWKQRCRHLALVAPSPLRMPLEDVGLVYAAADGTSPAAADFSATDSDGSSFIFLGTE